MKNIKASFGATVGRYAGPIANARFSIDGKAVRFSADDGRTDCTAGAARGSIRRSDGWLPGPATP